MLRLSGPCRALLAAAAAVVSTSLPAMAGFTPEQLAGFEVTHLRGTVSTVLPDQNVLEIIDP